MRRILVTGAAGQLAGAIIQEFSTGYDVVGLTHPELDITQQGPVSARVAELRPAVIINCAAYNRVDEAEGAPATAFDINAFAVRCLARAASEVGAQLVHYSTDFVFSGTATRPYDESDPPDPPSVYATSKLVGEWFARDAPVSYVLRVESLFGGTKRTSSVDLIVDAIREDREARVFADRTISPSYVHDVAVATRRLLETKAAPGLYHCVNSGQATWLELAHEAARLLGRPGRFLPVNMGDAGLRARRPMFSVLSNQKLAAAGIDMPTWQEALGRYVDGGGRR